MSTMRNGFIGLVVSLTGCTAYYPQGYGYGQGYGYATGFPAPLVTGYVAPVASYGYRPPVYAPGWNGGYRGGYRGGHEHRGPEHHDRNERRERHRG